MMKPRFVFSQDVPRWGMGIILALIPFAVGWWGVWLGQDVNWDLRNYHLYNPYALLTGRYAALLDLMPSHAQFFYNPLIDVPFYLLAAHLPAKAAHFILGAVQGLNCVLLYFIARHVLRREAGAFFCLFLALAGMTGPLAVMETGAVYGDNIASLGVFASLLFVLAQLEGAGEGRSSKTVLRGVALAGVLAGLAAGLKLTTAPFAAGLAIGILFSGKDRGQAVRIALAFCAGAGVGFLLGYGYWGWFLYTHFGGNPFFPYFNGFFKSSLGLLPPGLSASAAMPPQPREALSVLDFIVSFFNPSSFSVESLMAGKPLWRDARIPVLFGLGLFFGIRRFVCGLDLPQGRAGAGASIVTPAMAAAFVLSALVFNNYRYLLPLEMLAPLLIFLGVMRLPWGREETRRRAAVAMILLAVITTRPMEGARRAAWTEHIVEMDAPPPIPDRKDVMVITLIDRYPYAYLLTRFPRNPSYIGIKDDALVDDGLRPGAALYAQIDRRIAAFQGRLMIFIPVRLEETAKRLLTARGLHLVPSSCRVFEDRLYSDGLPDHVRMTRLYAVCDVRRSTP